MIHKEFVIAARGSVKVNLKPVATKGSKTKLNRKSQTSNYKLVSTTCLISGAL